LRGARGDQAQDGIDDAANGGHFASGGVFSGGHGVVVTKQLVGAVDEMNVQGSNLDQSVTPGGAAAKIRRTLFTLED